MEKLECFIKTLKPGELQDFKKQLKGKSASSENKRYTLLNLLQKGKTSTYIKKKIYGTTENTNNAYYQLRKALVEELELFTIYNRRKNNSYTETLQKLELANHCINNLNHDLAFSYIAEAKKLAFKNFHPGVLSEIYYLQSKLFSQHVFDTNSPKIENINRLFDFYEGTFHYADQKNNYKKFSSFFESNPDQKLIQPFFLPLLEMECSCATLSEEELKKVVQQTLNYCLNSQSNLDNFSKQKLLSVLLKLQVDRNVLLRYNETLHEVEQSIKSNPDTPLSVISNTVYSKAKFLYSGQEIMASINLGNDFLDKNEENLPQRVQFQFAFHLAKCNFSLGQKEKVSLHLTKIDNPLAYKKFFGNSEYLNLLIFKSIHALSNNEGCLFNDSICLMEKVNEENNLLPWTEITKQYILDLKKKIFSPPHSGDAITQAYLNEVCESEYNRGKQEDLEHFINKHLKTVFDPKTLKLSNHTAKTETAA